MIIPGAILSFKSLENEDWMVVYVCSSSGLRNRSKKKKIISSCMNSDEIDQTSAPPHPSRTATRSPKRLRVPRRNPEISDFYRASRTAENSKPTSAYRGESIRPLLRIFLRFSIPGNP
ncbi:hypothetical protein E3N88_04253 [Mikania micrantha]|uniref:Uncharacterized protein n=1 Tax=Mikania micrantha TaxID=192012 RepID=A0A5N6PTX8_9ASTR|nr:hypothetical protein E3N88_04253 [Mikania micrantha]